MALKWEDYDPSWLVTLARDQRPDLPWLPEAFAGCTRASSRTSRRHGRRVREVIYLHFVDPERANQPGADWQIDSGLWLRHPTDGILNIDVLKGQRVGGVEFYDRLFSNPKG